MSNCLLKDVVVSANCSMRLWEGDANTAWNLEDALSEGWMSMAVHR